MLARIPMNCCTLLPALLALTQTPHALDTSDPHNLLVLDGTGSILFSIATNGGDLPPGLTPQNAFGLVDGTWRRDGHGNWFYGAPQPAQATDSAALDACIQFDPVSVAWPQQGGILDALYDVRLEDSAGNVTLLANSSMSPLTQLRSVRSTDHSGGWTAPETVVPNYSSFTVPDATVALDDVVSVVYRVPLGGSVYDLYVTRSQPGGGWSTPQLAHAGSDFIQTYDILALDDGDLILAFQEGAFSSTAHWTRWDASTGTWTPATLLSPSGVSCQGITLRASPDRTRVMVGYLGFGATTADDGLYTHEWDPGGHTFLPIQKVPGSEDVAIFFGLGSDTELSFQVESDGDASIHYAVSLLLVNTWAIAANRYEGGTWQAQQLFELPLTSVPELVELGDNATVTPGDRTVGLAMVRQNGSDPIYDLRAIVHDPVTGWSYEEPGVEVSVGFFQPIPRAQPLAYSGERVLAVYNDNSFVKSVHSNGLDWSVGEVTLPAATTTALWQTAGGEVVVVDDGLAPDMLGTWMHGTSGFSDLGGALAGATGEPVLQATCDQAPSEPVTFTLSNAAQTSIAVLVLGTSRIDLPIVGGTLIPSPDFVQPVQVTDSNGDLAVSFTWAPTVPSGLALYYQYWIFDPAGPAGWAASNGLSGLTP